MKNLYYSCFYSCLNCIIAVSLSTEKQNTAGGQVKGVGGKDTAGTVAPKNVTTEELAWKEQPVYSYQQISCLDSVIR